MSNHFDDHLDAKSLDVPSGDQRHWILDLVYEYEGPLIRYATRITGDLERGRDAVQETFVQLCRHDRSDLDGHLRQWLYTVCRNAALDIQRKEKRVQHMTSQQAAAQMTRERPQAEVSEQQDSFAHIQLALTHLSENQQEVVRLKFQDGLSYKEIAHVTQLSVSNVGYLIHTAIQSVRKQLTQQT